MAQNIIYQVHSGLYINLTNRCPCACVFCIRQSADGVHGSDSLWLEHEPSFDEVKSALEKEDLSKYSEAVFCGYGEPTEALDVLLKTAEFLKSKTSLPVRINTNGLGNLIHKKDITPLLKGKIDAISISLNSSDPENYEKTVRPIFKEKAFPAMIEFAEKAAKFVPSVTMTTVSTTISHKDEENCRKICEKIGVKYRIREFVPA